MAVDATTGQERKASAPEIYCQVASARVAVEDPSGLDLDLDEFALSEEEGHPATRLPPGLRSVNGLGESIAPGFRSVAGTGQSVFPDFRSVTGIRRLASALRRPSEQGGALAACPCLFVPSRDEERHEPAARECDD
jgi:hypothetical protein